MDRWDGLDDDALLAATATEPQAFAAFYRRHVNAVLLFCRRRTGASDLAFDLCAEVFAAALVASGRYRRRNDTALPWLYGIARRKLADSARRGRIEDRARRRLAMEPIALDDESAADTEELLADLPAGAREAVHDRAVDVLGYEQR